MATDACEGGYGVISGEFAPSLVSSWGRRLERHRFRFQSAIQGRKHALGEFDPFSALETVEDLSGEREGRHVADGTFDEISLPALHPGTNRSEALARVPGLRRIEPKKQSALGFWNRTAQATRRKALATMARRVGPPF